MDSNIAKWQTVYDTKKKLFKQFLDKVPVGKTLPKLSELHNNAFAEINCLHCAACCKNYSPRFKTPDIKRISKHLRMKESVFIETYLNLDMEGDYVVNKTPCPFLGADNYCSIYENRPSDCSRFPYTNEDVLLKRKHITLKNASFCAAVVHVLDNLTKMEKK